MSGSGPDARCWGGGKCCGNRGVTVLIAAQVVTTNRGEDHQ
jgi:hypothetical protein